MLVIADTKTAKGFIIFPEDHVQDWREIYPDLIVLDRVQTSEEAFERARKWWAICKQGNGTYTTFLAAHFNDWKELDSELEIVGWRDSAEAASERMRELESQR